LEARKCGEIGAEASRGVVVINSLLQKDLEDVKGMSKEKNASQDGCMYKPTARLGLGRRER
jgi:hypothetical protein